MTFNPSDYQDLYPFQSRFFDRNGLKIHYIDEGEGDPLVMVHGNPTWSFYFRNLVQTFKTGYRTIAIDHIGCGLSDKPDDLKYDYRLKSRIDDLEALLGDLGISGKITLILHDWGGAIGMGFAARHPESISRVVVLNTFAFRLPSSKSFPLALWLGRNTQLGALLIRGLNAFAAASSMVAPKKGLGRKARKGYLAPYDSWENRIATLRFVQDIPLFPGDPSYQDLVKIEESLAKFAALPMLICWGELDFVFDTHFRAEWQRRFPQAEVHSFPDCGHYILDDAREKIIPILTEFLKRYKV